MRTLKLTFSQNVLMLLFSIGTIFQTNFMHAQCDSGTLGGFVFEDANLNGNFEDEDGLENILVTLFDTDNQIVDQTITDSDGDFSFSGLVDGSSYRIEYDFASDYSVSFAGANNQTDIQFAEAPFCNLALGLAEEIELCTENPDLFLTCFVRGDETENRGFATLIGVQHDFTGASNVSTYATKSETGSVWGMVYKKSTNQIYSSAFVKQYASLIGDMHDAIYLTTEANGTWSTSLFTTLTSLGVDAGTLSITDSQDCAFGSQVGKIGIGSIELSPDQQYLYASNLYNNTIVKINLSNPSPATTTVINMPAPYCIDEHIFALKVYDGKLFVGSTCTAESKASANASEAVVYEMDLATSTFTRVFNTNATKGYWIDTPSDAQDTQHWLTDIDFTEEGNMLLALSDRKGHKFCNAGTGRVDQQYGDLLMAWNDNGTWRLENNGQAGTLTGSGQNNGDGPGGGEFFGDDYWLTNPLYHNETNLGSIYVHPGSGEVVTTVFDPLFDSYSGGLHRYKTNTGNKADAIQLYTHNLTESFGKATGFGNITSGCDVPRIEIGNFVWEDINGNGIQDGGEKPFEGVAVKLYDDQCNEVGSTITDANGNYYFNESNVDKDGDGTFDGIASDACYYVTLDLNTYDQTSKLYNVGDNYYINTVNVNSNRTNSDFSGVAGLCPLLDGHNAVKVLTSNAKITDYTFDIGLKLPEIFDLALIKLLVSEKFVRLGDTATFEIKIFNQGEIIASEITITDYLADGFIFNQDLNPNWKYNAADETAKFKIDELLFPGNTTSIYIDLEVTTAVTYEDYVNRAEISGAIDYFEEPGDDIDSTPDDIDGNDAGGVVTGITDNTVTGDGVYDEDELIKNWKELE